MTMQEEDIENFLFFYNDTTCYISSNYIDDITDTEISLLRTKEIHSIEKKLVYVISCNANIIGYMDKEQNFHDIENKKVIIPKLKTKGTSEQHLKITIVNAEILDDSEVNDEIKLGMGNNALTLVAQKLWLEKSSSDNNNYYYTIINYCISNSTQIRSCEVYMNENYKYSITKENTYIKYVKYENNTYELKNGQFYIPYIYIAENLENIHLLNSNFFYESTIPDIKSPFYGDSEFYINGKYRFNQICLSKEEKIHLYDNNIYFLYDKEQNLTKPLSCIKESLNVESIEKWLGNDTSKDFKIHNLKKLKITDLTIPTDHKLRNLDGDIEITEKFAMESNSVIQCKKLTF